MTRTRILLTSLLLLAGCGHHSDAAIRKSLPGTWNEKSGAGKIVFSPDGSFTTGGDTNHDAGTWQISGEMLTLTITNSTGTAPVGKLGPTVQGRIIRVDSHSLTYTSGGRTYSFSR